MKATWLLIASIICFSICINTLSYGQNIANANNKELILVIEVTRHGARSPIGPPNTWLNTTWEVGTGQLTNIGERQQYLNGVKLRKMYIEDAKFLPDQFDPKYFYVKSSDFNRTVMSAISQMQGLYPLEKGLAFSSNSEKQQAMPPFPITEPNDLVNSDDVLPSRATTVPVHVQLNKYDFLLRAYDSLVCPIMGELKEEGEEEADENSQKELKPLYNELREKFGVPDENLNLAGAEFYIDSYVMGKLEGKTLPNELSIQAQQLLDSYYKHLYFDGIYAFKKTSRLAASTFMQYLNVNIRAKINAYNGDQNVSDFHKNIKFILLSAHDTTIAGFLTAVGQAKSQTTIPPLASMLLIEVYKKNQDFFLSWNYNGEYLNINDNCNSEGDCNLEKSLDFFKELTVDELIEECNDLDALEDEIPLLSIILLVLGCLGSVSLFVAIWLYWTKCRGEGNEAVEEYQELRDYNNINNEEAKA